MAVASANYGNFDTHSGTIIEVATVLKGNPSIGRVKWVYNGTNVTAIVQR